MMLDFFADIPLLSLLIKFMVASTLMFGTIWCLEKIGLLKAPDLAELGWKLAIAGSFLALLPVGDWLSSPITIAHERASELAQEFNEGQPFARTAPQTTTTFKAEANETAPQQITMAPPLPTRQDTTEITNAGLSADMPATADQSPRLEITSFPSTSGASVQSPVTDSEDTTIKVEDPSGGFVGALATLRTKDIAVLMWAALALAATVLLAVAYVSAVRGLGSRRRVDAEHKANRTLRAICVDVNIKHVPYLSRSTDIKSPVCLPRREICLPDWAFDDMPEEELKSLLAHEIAHMLRRDPLMLMVLQILSRVFFFQPLFMLARKRLTDLAELAADEWAAKQIADARAVAAALYTCATKIQENRQIQWGLAMAGNKSMLRTRVERLMGSDTVPFQNTSRVAKAAMVGGMMTVTLGLPSIQFASALSANSPLDMERAGGEGQQSPMTADDTHSAEVEANLERLVASAHPHDSIPTTDEVWAQVQAEYEAERQNALKQQEKQWAKLAERAKANGWTEEKIAEMMERVKSTVDFPELETLVTMAEFKDMAITAAIANNVHPFDDETKEEIAAAIAEAHAEAEAAVREAEVEMRRNAEHLERLKEEGFGRMSVNDHGGSGNMVWNDDERTIKVRWEGKFELSDDEKSIKRMDDGSELEIRFKGEGPRRKIRFEGDGDKIVTTYWVDRSKTELDDAGRKWLGDTLAMLVREMGFNAEKRVARFLKQGGPDAVIAEMKQIESDFVVRLYTNYLLDQANLSEKQIGKLMDRLEKIDSDYELRLALTSLFVEEKLGDKIMPRVLKAAKSIDSDYELRLLLTPYLERFGVTDRTMKVVLDLAEGMESDYEMRLLLSAALTGKELDRKSLEKFAEIAAKQIDSDYEKRLLLSVMASQYGKSKDATRIVIEALGTIDGDYERRLTLGMIVEHGAFDKKSWIAAIEAAAAIDSDYEKRLALSALKGRLPNDAAVQEAFAEAVASIGSDYERGRLSKASGTSVPAVARAPRVARTPATRVAPRPPAPVADPDGR